MAKEIHLFGNKKDGYPTKTTINFYIKENKSNSFSTAFLYLLFGAVVLLALAKMTVFDLLGDLNREKAAYTRNQTILENNLESLADFDEVNTEYNRYSYSYLAETDKVQDRMDILDILEQTIFEDSNVISIAISDNVVSVSLAEVDLEGTSELAKKLESYEMVQSVSVNTASFGGTYTSNMVIQLKAEVEAQGGTGK